VHPLFTRSVHTKTQIVCNPVHPLFTRHVLWFRNASFFAIHASLEYQNPIFIECVFLGALRQLLWERSQESGIRAQVSDA